MLIENTRGIANLIRRKPRSVASMVIKNIEGRLYFRFSRGTNSGDCRPPEQVTIVVTDTCNLRCKMCQYAFSDSQGYQLNQVGCMSQELFHKLLAETPGRPIVSFTGGEPLLHPDLMEMIGKVHSRGCPCTVTTNGWLLKKRAWALADAGLDFLVVSVDGPPDLHNRIRGKNSFERLSEGLEAILKISQRPIVFVNTTISDLNYRRLPEVVEMAKGWEVDGLNFNHLWMQTPDVVEAHNLQFASLFEADEISWQVDPNLLDPECLADTLEGIRRNTRGGRMIFMETPYLKREDILTWYRRPYEFVNWRNTRCAWIRLKVWPDGRVKPCRDWSVGNIRKNSVMEIWNSPGFRRFRTLLNEYQTIPICSRCCYMAHR